MIIARAARVEIMPILLTELIARVPSGIEPRVRRVRDQVQKAVRDALREECRLMFRVPTDPSGAQVPVEVSPGHPGVLKGIEFPDDFGSCCWAGIVQGLSRPAMEPPGC